MKIPLKEKLSSIPGLVGIRLEEQPDYDVVTSSDGAELRQYHEMVIAKTVVEGDRDHAVDEGFRRLAGYIFGENQTSMQMSMTSPVLQSPDSQSTENHEASETMSMTSPVLQEQTGSSSWTISFILPSDVTLQSAPKPLDSRVELGTVQPRLLASYRYTGNNTMERMKDAEQKLLDWVKANNLRPTGSVQWAQYDQPFAVPFLKRNEAQIEVAKLS